MQFGGLIRIWGECSVNFRLLGWIRRLAGQVVLALLFALVIYAEHKLFYQFNGSLVDFVEFKHFVNVGIAYFIFTFISSPRARLGAYLLLPVFTFIQRLHQAYFGIQVYPIEIWHLFIQLGEVSESFFGNLSIYLLPLALFAFTMGGCLILYQFDRNLFRIKYLGWVLVLVFSMAANNGWIAVKPSE
jgi:hypothetical protein